jgi:hypothetical protein
VKVTRAYQSYSSSELRQVEILASYYPGRGQSKHPLAGFPTVSPTIVQSLDLANGNDLSVENMNTQRSLPAIDTNTSEDDMTLIFIPGQGDSGELPLSHLMALLWS